MTSTADQGARRGSALHRSNGDAGNADHHRISRSLFATMPIVLAGSVAVSLNLTGPLHPVDTRTKDKPRAAHSELGKSIREAFAAAARAATNPSPVVSESVEAGVAAVAPTSYTVTAGDSVSSIAGHYGLATASVLALNGLSWKSVIFPGQILKLTNGPSGIAPVVKSPSSSSSRYTIEKGDTISHIAARFGIGVQTLLSANGLGWASTIFPGQTLAIPGATTAALSEAPVVQRATAPARAPGGYVIKAGDTIAGIASKFGVTTQALLGANGLGWGSIIFTGHTLSIPALAIETAASITPYAVLTPSSVLTAEMATNARTIIRVGRSLGVPDYGIVVALAAAAQESGLRNLNYGDRDSLGLFQQRPSAGWGTPEQILDPAYSAKLFFGGPTNPNAGSTRGLLEIPAWQLKTVTQAAQSVQRSAYPDAYAKWEKPARSWLTSLR